MRRTSGIACALCATLLAFGVSAYSAEPAEQAVPPAAAPQAKPAKSISPQQLAELIAQLDDNAFQVRKAATEQLIAAGAGAIAAVSKAATGESLEVTSRAIEVLRRLRESDDPATQGAAQAALERLAKSDHEAARQRASAVLEPEDKAQAVAGGNVQGRVVIGGPIQANVIIQAQAVPAAPVKVDDNLTKAREQLAEVEKRLAGLAESLKQQLAGGKVTDPQLRQALENAVTEAAQAATEAAEARKRLE